MVITATILLPLENYHRAFLEFTAFEFIVFENHFSNLFLTDNLTNRT